MHLREDAAGLFTELSRYSSRILPNGKQAIEISLSDFPHIRTASRTRVEAVVVLDRRAAAHAELQPIPAAIVAGMILQDMPWYGDEVHARYQRAVDRLLEAPAYRLTYADLDEAVAVLNGLALR